jgi:uncharacterized protein
LLEEVPKEGEQMKMLGSAMVASASSKEELLEILKNDIYAKSEVWDFDKVSFDGSFKRVSRCVADWV